jgi:hypothetical protein
MIAGAAPALEQRFDSRPVAAPSGRILASNVTSYVARQDDTSVAEAMQGDWLGERLLAFWWMMKRVLIWVLAPSAAAAALYGIQQENWALLMEYGISWVGFWVVAALAGSLCINVRVRRAYDKYAHDVSIGLFKEIERQRR